MTDERDRDRGLIPRAEAMARALRPKDPAAERAAEAPGGLGAGLHDLLRDMAAYLGDRPNRDHDAMALYGRVMRMLGDSGS